MNDKESLVVYEPKVISTEEEAGKTLANQYFAENKVGDFTKVPREVKLALLQITHPRFIKKRKVAAVQIPYIDHFYAEKCLNFIFNFEVSCEIISKEFIKQEKGTEAEVQMRFTFGTGEKKITRDVYSSHKGFPNPATTRGDILKSAISKSWSVVARTFGVGTNLAAMEQKAYARVAKKAPPKPAEPKKAVEKAWDKV